MTNAEKYRTEEERDDAFANFCDQNSGIENASASCATCPCFDDGDITTCFNRWLRLEANKKSCTKSVLQELEEMLSKLNSFDDEINQFGEHRIDIGAEIAEASGHINSAICFIRKETEVGDGK